MSLSVVVPLAGDCLHRARAWQWVRAQYDGLKVCEGYGDPERWVKADAVADGLSRATGDLLVIHDSDVWSDHLQSAIDAVESGQVQWASPHHHVRRLTESGTEQFFNGERETALVDEDHHAVLGGGIVVLKRETYERCPLDPRFIGWGSEDHAWGYALRTLAGKPFKARQVLWHLWHPPQARMNRKVGNVKSDEIRARYRAASFQPGPMRRIVEEGRCLSSGSSLQR